MGTKLCECGGTFRCKDSRPSPQLGVWVRRTYDCDQCESRITTHESIVGGSDENSAPVLARAVWRLRNRLRNVVDATIEEEIGAEGLRQIARAGRPRATAKRDAK